MSDTVIVALIAAGIPFITSIIKLLVDHFSGKRNGLKAVSQDLTELKDVAITNGNNITAIKEEVNNLREELTHHKVEFNIHIQEDARMQVQQLRGVIIEFSKRIDKWKAGKLDSVDEFEDSEYWATYIHYVDLYEELCATYNIKNGVCQNAIKKIRKAYEEVSFA